MDILNKHEILYRNNRLVVYIIIFIISLLVRLTKTVCDPLLLRDSAFYLFLAEKWHETGLYANIIDGYTVFPPLPLFLTKQMMYLGFSSEICGRSISIFLGSCLPVIGYIISLKLFKRESIAVISAIFYIFHPTLTGYSIQPLRDNYYLIIWSILSLVLIKSIRYNKTYDWITCGILIAFAFFCRYESLEAFPIVFFLIGYRFGFKHLKIILKKFFFVAAAFFVTSVLLLKITDWDISFIKRINQLSEDVIGVESVGNINKTNPKINQ